MGGQTALRTSSETVSWFIESKKKGADVSMRKASESVAWSAAEVE